MLSSFSLVLYVSVKYIGAKTARINRILVNEIKSNQIIFIETVEKPVIQSHTHTHTHKIEKSKNRKTKSHASYRQRLQGKKGHPKLGTPVGWLAHMYMLKHAPRLGPCGYWALREDVVCLLQQFHQFARARYGRKNTQKRTHGVWCVEIHNQWFD